MRAAIRLGPNFLIKSEIYKDTEYSSPTWTRSILARDQAVKWAKAKVCVYADSFCVLVGCKTVQQIEDLKKYSSYKTQLASTEKQLNSSGKFLWIFVVITSSRDPERLGGKEHQARRLQRSNHLHVNVQWHYMEKEWRELYFECRRSQESRHEFLTRTLNVSGCRIGREVVWKFPRSKKDSGIAPPTKWYSDSKNLVILS